MTPIPDARYADPVDKAWYPHSLVVWYTPDGKTLFCKFHDGVWQENEAKLTVDDFAMDRKANPAELAAIREDFEKHGPHAKPASPQPASFAGPSVPFDCCGLWAVTDTKALLLGNGHNPKCSAFVSGAGAEQLIAALVRGMECWASDEDGVHPEAWEAYSKAKFVLTGTHPKFDREEANPPVPSQPASSPEGVRASGGDGAKEAPRIERLENLYRAVRSYLDIQTQHNGDHNKLSAAWAEINVAMVELEWPSTPEELDAYLTSSPAPADIAPAQAETPEPPKDRWEGVRVYQAKNTRVFRVYGRSGPVEFWAGDKYISEFTFSERLCIVDGDTLLTEETTPKKSEWLDAHPAPQPAKPAPQTPDVCVCGHPPRYHDSEGALCDIKDCKCQGYVTAPQTPANAQADAARDPWEVFAVLVEDFAAKTKTYDVANALDNVRVAAIRAGAAQRSMVVALLKRVESLETRAVGGGK